MVRILTYNVHSCIGRDGKYDVQRVADAIARADVDLVCLQEAEVNSKPRKVRTYSAKHADNQPELLARATGLRNVSFSGPLCAYEGEYKRGCCEDQFDEVLTRDWECTSGLGNAVLSKYEILDSRSLVFDGSKEGLSEQHIYMDREPVPRGARAVLINLDSMPFLPGVKSAEEGEAGQEATMAVEKQGLGASRAYTSCCRAPSAKSPESKKKPDSRALLWVVSTQLSHKLCCEEQREQAKQLITWVDGLAGEKFPGDKLSVVICGDFNAPPFAPCSSYSALSSGDGWADLWKENGTWCNQSTSPVAFGSCCPTALGTRRDHIFALQRDGLTKVSCDRICIAEEGVASLHCPVMVDLKMDGAKKYII